MTKSLISTTEGESKRESTATTLHEDLTL